LIKSMYIYMCIFFLWLICIFIKSINLKKRALFLNNTIILYPIIILLQNIWNQDGHLYMWIRFRLHIYRVIVSYHYHHFIIKINFVIMVLKILNILHCFDAYCLLNYRIYEIYTLLWFHNNGWMIFELSYVTCVKP
jgi:hypothetical protein